MVLHVNNYKFELLINTIIGVSILFNEICVICIVICSLGQLTIKSMNITIFNEEDIINTFTFEKIYSNNVTTYFINNNGTHPAQ